MILLYLAEVNTLQTKDTEAVVVACKQNMLK
jgi:hypothetical protein